MINKADTEGGQILGGAIIEAIEKQLADNDPSEAKRTLKRLIRDGESRENAIRYMSCVLTDEMFRVVKNNEPYNHKRYINNLKKLPQLPDE